MKGFHRKLVKTIAVAALCIVLLCQAGCAPTIRKIIKMVTPRQDLSLTTEAPAQTAQPAPDPNWGRPEQSERPQPDTAAQGYDYAESYSLGDTVWFGSYEQDGDVTDGKESISWKVIGKKHNAVLLLSDLCLDCMPYNQSGSDTTWETCSLRNWLNYAFYESAFNVYERQFVLWTNLENADNPWYGTNGGITTTDRVFCLSLDEYNALVYADPYGHPSEYAAYMGVEVFNENYCPWWLRSAGGESRQAAFVWVDKDNGGPLMLFGGGTEVDNPGIGVRPAIWMSVEP